jgi:hypothetical protein
MGKTKPRKVRPLFTTFELLKINSAENFELYGLNFGQLATNIVSVQRTWILPVSAKSPATMEITIGDP